MQRSRVKVNGQERKITLRELECGCQLVGRLKANECYQELLRYLSSYINLLSIRLFARVSGLRLSATNDVTTPGFILIVSLTISLWSYCSDRFDRSDRIAGRIVDRIALIALIALTVSLVVLLIASL